MTERERRDLYQEVTDRIVRMLEEGVAPWQRPWSAPGDALTMPISGATGKPYRGINHLLLGAEAFRRGYGDPRWFTVRQANELGARIRKGERGTAVYFFKPYEIREQVARVDPETGEERIVERVKKVPVLRRFVVFNGDQIEGIPPHERKPMEWEPHEKAQEILDRSGADIRHGGDRAYYSRAGDYIQLPPREAFRSAGDYYGTALHELGHWTGHERRLNRQFGAFGDPRYAREELRAEIASAMLSAELRIPHDPTRHAAYVGSWIEALRNDKREIFRAARDAQEICDYLMGRELYRERVAEQARQAGLAGAREVGARENLLAEACRAAEGKGCTLGDNPPRPRHTGQYTGRVLHANDLYVVQSVGRGEAVIHARGRLDRSPAAGQTVTIRYGRDGRARVIDRDPRRSRGLDR